MRFDGVRRVGLVRVERWLFLSDVSYNRYAFFFSVKVRLFCRCSLSLLFQLSLYRPFSGCQERFNVVVVSLHGQGLKCNDELSSGLFWVDGWTFHITPDTSTSAAQLVAANASCLVD